MTPSVGQLSFIYVICCWVYIGILVGLLFYRTYSVLYLKKSRLSFSQIKGHWYPKILKIALSISMALVLVNAPIYGYVASAFKSIIPQFLNHLIIIVSLWVAIWELYLSFSISEKLMKKTYKKVILTLIVVILLPISVFSLITIPDMFKYPHESESVLLEIPVRGVWVAGHAGEHEGLNYHNATKSQKYAIDIVKVGPDGKFYQNEGRLLKDFYTFTSPIYAPADGQITQVVDNLPNIGVTFTPSDTANPAGNHIVLKIDENTYVFLAHLDSASVLVDSGMTVRAGELLASAGNSGNTSWPHLHMHVQDYPTLSFDSATGIPFRFKEMALKRWLSWTIVQNDFIIRNDLFYLP